MKTATAGHKPSIYAEKPDGELYGLLTKYFNEAREKPSRVFYYLKQCYLIEREFKARKGARK